MKASVIIPTYNREGIVVNALKALLKQSLESEEFQVIVVNDGSTDSTDSEIRQFFCTYKPQFWQYIKYKENHGRAAALNLGIQVAKAPLIVFTDDDCVPSHHWVEMHVMRHTGEDGPVAVLGAVSFPEAWIEESNFVRYANSRYVGNRSVRSVGGDLNNLPPRYFGGLNVSVPKTQLIEVGLFDHRIGRGQDVELGYRLWKEGIRLVYEPRAIITHYEPEVHSISIRIEKQAKVYYESKPLIKKLHPDMVDKFGNWFFEPPHFNSEPLRRTIGKILIRLIVVKFIARYLLDLLELTDRRSFFYLPLLYKYVLAYSCLESVRRRDL